MMIQIWGHINNVSQINNAIIMLQFQGNDCNYYIYIIATYAVVELVLVKILLFTFETLRESIVIVLV